VSVDRDLQRDINSLVDPDSKLNTTELDPAEEKDSIGESVGVATLLVVATPLPTPPVTPEPPVIASPLTEVSRVEASFTVAAGGTIYVPTQVTMHDANGKVFVFNYATPTIG